MSFQVTKWLKFFKDAGIPSGHATNYAMKFCDHRIQDSMLPDLDKEILKDMSITVMGDIISILKHAREVHAQSEREKMASQMPTVETTSKNDKSDDTEAIFSAAETPPGSKRKSAAANQMVDNWISDVRASTTVAKGKDSPPPMKLKIQVSDNSHPSPAVKTLSLSERFSATGGGSKKIKISPATTEKSGKKIITVKKKAAAAAALSKAKSLKKQSVFERLGDEVPSNSNSPNDGKVTKVMTGTNQIKKNTDAVQKVKGTSSVFSRLGNKAQPSSPVTTTVKVTPILKRTQVESSDEEREDNNSKIDYTSHSILRPPKTSYSSKLVSDSITTKSPKPVKHVKPVKRTVGFVSSTVDSKKISDSSRSVFARLGSKV